MSPSAPAAPQLCADDVLAFSDDQLVKYMLQKRSSAGGFELDDVVGWANVSLDKRTELAQRLRAGAAMAGEAVQSRCVDLDQVARRLQAISDGDGDKNKNSEPSASALARPKRRALVPTPPETKRIYRSPEELQRMANEEGKISETEYYYDLVKEGGRPCYPISMLEDVFEDPDGHREMLRPLTRHPFADSAPDWWWVFSGQWWTWEDFRKWRQEMRGTYDTEAECAIDFRKQMHFHTVMEREYWIEAVEADPSKHRKSFAAVEEKRRREQLGLLEFPGEGLAAYSKAVEQRLAEHGFTQAFRLEEDPSRQDKLTTWIEYLNYEYCRHDKFVKLVELLQPKRDEAWQKLVDSGAMRPGETEEYLRSIECGCRRQDEIDRAWKAWKEAQAAGFVVLDSARCIPTSTKRQQAMKAAQARAERAKAQLTAAKSRSALITKFVRETRYHTDTKVDVRRSVLLLEWILAQIPLIEVELKEEAGVRVGAGAGAGDAPRGKRGRDQDDDNVTDKPSPKKQRRCGRRTSSPANGSFSLAVEAEGVSNRPWAEEDSEPALAEPRVDRLVRSKPVTTHEPPQTESRGPRHSARLAALRPERMQAPARSPVAGFSTSVGVPTKPKVTNKMKAPSRKGIIRSKG